MNCKNCGKTVYGFWIYEPNQDVCSLQCLRELISTRKISRLNPAFGYPELHISDPVKFVDLSKSFWRKQK